MSHKKWDAQEKSHFFISSVQGSLGVPKSSGFIDENERRIAGRVRQVRYANQLSQFAFARALGISLDRLASIEYARTPLTVGVADKISSKFDVSLIWLAQGRGRMNPCVGLISQTSPEIKASTLLSAAFSEDLERRFREHNLFSLYSMVAIGAGEAGLPKGKEVQHYVEHFHHEFDDLFHGLPHRAKEKLLALIVRTLAKFSADWETGNRETPGENITMLPKKDLTDVSDSGNLNLVKPQMPDFLDRLKKATAERGKKTALAKFLKVPLASVSQWLSGDRNPDGENTLRLLRWVEQQERQK